MLESATHKLPRLHTVWGIREKELFFRVMLQCLVSGIEECRDVWFLKVADEVEGRGVWVFDATKLSFYKDITSIVRQANMRDIDEFVGTEQYSRFMQTLESEIDEIAVPLYPNMTGYSDWNSFLISFIASGGIIQSCPALRNRAEAKLTFPTLHALLEPDGKLKLVGSHEKADTFACNDGSNEIGGQTFLRSRRQLWAE
ncbi:hypothetical protein BKA69DRAFT_777224 [Paraphysoderma sedebokerense]|nr:hypothetical protein BKA69DRAFT_777224 [Paraphysoderma sedebokerense]